jgi:hypothetical protein
LSASPTVWINALTTDFPIDTDEIGVVGVNSSTPTATTASIPEGRIAALL